jgi:peptidoglycan-associated lipoprotein
MNKALKIITISVVTATFLAACSTTKAPEAPAQKPAPVATVPMPSMTRAVTPVVAPEVDPLNDPSGILAKRSIYFDFNKYNVKPEFDALNSAHAKYLASHASRTVVIQGNTDSRGGREYNLALGQKRAEAEGKVLATLGVSSSRMEVVSFGKEKPKASGENEAAWAENRRADLVYGGK